MIKKSSLSLSFELPGNYNLTITFQYNISSRQCTKPISVRAFLSLQNRRSPKYSFTASMTPSWLSNCVPPRWVFSLFTDRSQKKPYQENMGDEEGFQIHIQSLQPWQLVACGWGVVLQGQNIAIQFFLPLSFDFLAACII